MANKKSLLVGLTSDHPQSVGQPQLAADRVRMTKGLARQQRAGVLFLNHVVSGYPVGLRYDDELEVEWG